MKKFFLLSLSVVALMPVVAGTAVPASASATTVAPVDRPVARAARCARRPRPARPCPARSLPRSGSPSKARGRFKPDHAGISGHPLHPPPQVVDRERLGRSSIPGPMWPWLKAAFSA